MTEENQVQTDSNDEIWSFLIDSLYAGPTEVLFEKADGTMRQMECSLRKDLITYEFPEGKEAPSEAESVDKKTEESVTVWDLEAKGWRKLTRGKIDTVNQLEEYDEPES